MIKAVGKDLKAPEGATDRRPRRRRPLPGDDRSAERRPPRAGPLGRGAFGAGEPTLDAFDAFLALHNRELLARGSPHGRPRRAPVGRARRHRLGGRGRSRRRASPSLVAKNQIVPCEISALETRSRPGAARSSGRRTALRLRPQVTPVPTTSMMMREGAAKAIDELVEGGKRYREAWEKYEKDFAEYEKKLAEWEKNKGTDSQPASRPAPAPSPSAGRRAVAAAPDSRRTSGMAAREAPARWRERPARRRRRGAAARVRVRVVRAVGIRQAQGARKAAGRAGEGGARPRAQARGPALDRRALGVRHRRGARPREEEEHPRRAGGRQRGLPAASTRSRTPGSSSPSARRSRSTPTASTA